MHIVTPLLTVAGLSLFEIVTSIDNAIINAEVLSTMGKKGRRWFLTWGLIFAVFIVRGMLPLLIVWSVNPGIGFIETITATFKSDPSLERAIETASPLLLLGGGTFLLFLFFHWLFLEPKQFGLIGEKFFYAQGVWFFAVASILLSTIVWFALKANPFMAFGAVLGSTAFFITHGFRENAEKREQDLLARKGSLSDTSKIFYLMVIDATFSMDGVLGSFAFTLSVPLILLGNGLGALVVRQLTVSNIERIKRYIYLKNGAMYSVLLLGMVMVLESFNVTIPAYISSLLTFATVGLFFLKSKPQAVSS